MVEGSEEEGQIVLKIIEEYTNVRGTFGLSVWLVLEFDMPFIYLSLAPLVLLSLLRSKRLSFQISGDDISEKGGHWMVRVPVTSCFLWQSR